MRKLLTLLVALVAISAWAADESVTFSEEGYTNQQVIDSFTGNDFTITFDKGTNSNSPKYFTSGSAIRAYGGNTFTVGSTTKTIAKIEITFGSSDGSNDITTDVGTYSSGIWTGSATSVVFTVGGTSGNRRLSTIAVTFQSTTPASTTTYTKVTNISGIVSGDNYVIVYYDETTPAVSGDYTSNALESVSGSGITLSGSTLTVSSAASAVPVKITGSDGEYQLQQTNSDAYYLGLNSGNISVGSFSSDNEYVWAISFDNGNAVVQNKGNTYRYLRYSSSTGFVAATSSTGSPVQLYREGTTGDETPTPAAPTFSPAAGTYTSAQSVTISAAIGTTIRYTIDGSDPTTSSSIYSSAIAVSETTTIKAIAVINGIFSPVASATYTIDTSSSGGGDGLTYEKVTSISSSDVGKKFIIVYEATPAAMGAISSTSTTYGQSITGTSNFTLSGSQITLTSNSSVAPLTLGGTSGAWTFLFEDGKYMSWSSGNSLASETSVSTKSQWAVTFSDGVPTIANGNDNTRKLQYNSASNSLRFACYTSSQQPVALYRQVSGSTTEQVATPVISPSDGTVITGPTSISISCATDGATIHYTTNGSTPTSASAAYSTAFTISATTTVKAIAVKSDMTDSEVASATITYQSASTGNEYTLVTDASTLASGDIVIIVVKDADPGASVMTAQSVSGVLKTSTTDVTLSTDENTITLDNDNEALVLTLEGSSNAWKFRSGSNYLYANPSNNGLTMDSKNSEKVHSISISNGDATIRENDTSDRVMRYNYNSGTNPRIGTYATTFGKAVQIYRQAAAASSVTTVTGIAAFKEVTAGETVRLYLPDSYNARVLHASQTAANPSAGTYTYDAYVRDNSGAMLIKGLVTTREMAHDQHIAGWLMGQYSTATDGNPQLTPDLCQSSDRTHCPWFVIADPVSETATEPVEIAATAVGSNLADWVKVSDITIGNTSLTLTDKFSTGYSSQTYTGAVVDVSAIAAAGTLYPVSLGDVPVITHVVDAGKAFVSPSSEISGTAVRFVREFTSGTWTPLTVPFAIDDFDGIVMEYVGLEQGDPVTGTTSGNSFDAGNMLFEQVYAIEAGVPYLVKAYDSMTEMTFSDVTLSNASAGSISFTLNGRANAPAGKRAVSATDTYTMTGTYSPTTFSTTDNSVKVMTSDGSVGWASEEGGSVSGTSAYFTTPSDQALRIVFDGSNGVITGIRDIVADSRATAPQGTYNLLGVKMSDDWQSLPAGIYIVNGVKRVKSRE